MDYLGDIFRYRDNRFSAFLPITVFDLCSFYRVQSHENYILCYACHIFVLFGGCIVVIQVDDLP